MMFQPSLWGSIFDGHHTLHSLTALVLDSFSAFWKIVSLISKGRIIGLVPGKAAFYFEKSTTKMGSLSFE
jgi:hypothetical protein